MNWLPKPFHLRTETVLVKKWARLMNSFFSSFRRVPSVLGALLLSGGDDLLGELIWRNIFIAREA